MYRKILNDYKRTGRYQRPDLEKLIEIIRNSDSITKEEDIIEVRNMMSQLPDYRKDQSDSKHKIAILVKELIGDRSIRRTAEDTGVAASYITGILQEKYLPSAKILSNLAKAESHPQNGVLIDDLMIAAGYQSEYMEEVIGARMFDEQKDNIIEDKGQTTKRMIVFSDNKERTEKAIEEDINDRIRTRHAFQAKCEKFEILARGLILQELMERGIHMKMRWKDAIGIRGFRPDIVIDLKEQVIDEWWINFRYLGQDTDDYVKKNMHVRQILGRYIFAEPARKRKISIVANCEEEFNIWKAFKDKLSFRGELSVIYIDPEKYAIVDEVYLSHFEQDNKELEIYLK